MNSDPVVPFDLARMFFGDESPLFLLEIVFRTCVIYVYTLMLIRWIGSRSIAQLSLVEFLLVIALGSAVGDAMFYPDVPLLHCMLVITVVVVLDKTLSFIVARKPGLEDLIEGKTVQLVRDGIIDCVKLRKLNLGHDELFEQLRQNGVEHMGQVRASYLETSGAISVFMRGDDSEAPGLEIEPAWDAVPPVAVHAGDVVEIPGRYACSLCGTVTLMQVERLLDPCPNCAGKEWHVAREPKGKTDRTASDKADFADNADT